MASDFLSRPDGIEKILSVVREDWHAFRVPLPPIEERPNKDTIACLDRWTMHLPGHHPLWNYYCLSGISLEDFPGVPPAYKKFPEATHEILVGAINPDFPKEALEKGGIDLLGPLNHVEQIKCSSDSKVNDLLRYLARQFVEGKQLPEPSGIMGARDLFHDTIQYWLKNNDTNS